MIMADLPGPKIRIGKLLEEPLLLETGDEVVLTVTTLTMNPAIDKSASVAQVIAERKLYCHSPRFEPGGGGVNVSRAIRNLGGESTALFPCGGLMNCKMLFVSALLLARQRS